jgi:hypothetical protein
VEEIQYSTFSGKRRLYLFDESHRLSTDALDALLKPMEDCVPESQDKSLVCIFCTTEPEKMRATILSRCAPAFVIKPVGPSQIGDRLEAVCLEEKLPYERDALNLIGELTECHIRDALKAVEGVSMLGPVNRENVSKYLHLDSHLVILEILSKILDDLPEALRKTSDLLSFTSPTTAYEKLAETAMLAYRVSINAATSPSYLDAMVVSEIGTRVGGRLLTYASRFASRPGRPTAAMLLCDVSQLHQEAVAPVMQYVAAPSPHIKTPTGVGTVVSEAKPKLVDYVYVHPRAVKASTGHEPVLPPSSASFELRPLEFFRLVKLRAGELEASKRDGTDKEPVAQGGPEQPVS